MDRIQKEQMVASLHDSFKKMELLVIAHYSGLTVSEMRDLRGQMRNEGASFKVAKNRLIRLALKGSKYENLTKMFSGPTAIAFSSDPVSAAKVAVKFAKKNKKLVVLGGGLGGKTLDVKAVGELALLPSIDQLRAKLMQLLMTPATRIIQLSQGPSSALAQVLRARAESK